MTIPLKTLLVCFFRTYFIGANINLKGLQNVGLSFAVDPALRALYPDFEGLKKARKRYLILYNTHPYWTPLLVGYFLFLESKIAQGLMAPSSLDNIKTTTIYTLSALGDAFFGASLLVFWSLILVCLLLSGAHLWGLVWFLVFFVVLHVFKFIIFWLGWNRGLAFLEKLQQGNLITWGQRIKFINMLLLLGIWYIIFPWESLSEKFFFPATGALAVLSYIVYKQFCPRECLFYIFIGAILLYGLF